MQKELTFKHGKEELSCLIEWSNSGELSINYFNPYTGYTNSQNVYLAARGMDITPDLEMLMTMLDNNTTWQHLCDILISWHNEADQTFELIDDKFHSA
jgi:hypothetical protein